MIRFGLRRTRHGGAIAVLEDLFARLGISRGGRREDVAVHITAGGERGKQRLVDFFDQRTQARLHDAMKLDALARRDAQRVVAVIGRQIIENTPLIGSHHAAGNAPADHHDILLASLAQITVVLLIAAVEFQELIVIIAEMIGAFIGHRGRDGAREGRNGFLNFLVMSQFYWLFFNHKLFTNVSNDYRQTRLSCQIPFGIRGTNPFYLAKNRDEFQS